MSRILIISSSMRKGNSDTLANEFFLGARKSNHDVEKIELRNKNIKYC